MAVTPGGSPYVEASDLVAAYPAVSLDLADHVDTKANLSGDTFTGSLTLSNADTSAFALRTITMSIAGATRAQFLGQRSGSGSGGQASIFVADSGGSVTNRLRIEQDGRIQGSGTSLGAWTAYTPVVSSDGAGTDWVAGNAVSTGNWMQMGKNVLVRFHITFGSTTVFGTKNLILSLPVTSVSYSAPNSIIGNAVYSDASAGSGYTSTLGFFTTTTFVPFAMNASATYTTRANITSTVPFTGASGDIITGTLIYEAA
jgi:hypothetical protein